MWDGSRASQVSNWTLTLLHSQPIKRFGICGFLVSWMCATQWNWNSFARQPAAIWMAQPLNFCRGGACKQQSACSEAARWPLFLTPYWCCFTLCLFITIVQKLTYAGFVRLYSLERNLGPVSTQATLQWSFCRVPGRHVPLAPGMAYGQAKELRLAAQK